jgi:phosphatidylserine/phosphatidylglycerophosphate/cardiolipin synthase-like enzyme
MHAFTDRDLRGAVKGAAERGVVIRLYLERIYINQEQVGAPSLEEICEAGPVKVRLEIPSSYLMHHKYTVINGQTVITGSYNWSDAADTNNWENLLVIQDQEMADKYSKDFNRLWDKYSGVFCE